MRLASVVDVVVVGFVDTNVVHLDVRGQHLGHLVPDVDGQMFGRRNHTLLHEVGNVLVEVLVVERIDHLEENILEVHQIERVAQLWDDFALDGGLNLVVVSMRAGMIATAELFAVLFVGHIRVVQPVGGTKRHGSREVGDWTHDDHFFFFLLFFD